MATDLPILVVGATGMQGGAVIEALLRQGSKVRALCRSESKGEALAKRGVGIAVGDMNDFEALVKAATGTRGVFSVQMPPSSADAKDDSEIRHGRNLVEAARKAGVETFVHTSVARAGDEKNFVGWDEGRWWKPYWEQKSGVNELVKNAGFKHWTVLKPSTIFENFLPRTAAVMYPALAKGSLDTAMEPDATMDMVAVDDIAAFAAAAFAQPAGFHAQEIDLASESLTMQEIATVLTEVLGKPIKVHSMSFDEVVTSGVYPLVVQNMVWENVEGYKVDIQRAKAFGIPFQSFADWVQKNKDRLEVGA